MKENVCVIYCRVSTEDQKDHGTSLDSQEQDNREFAESKGWRILRVVKEDMSAMRFDRPGLSAVKQDIAQSKANILLCKETDRLTRDPYHLASICHEVFCYNGQVWFLKNGQISRR